MSCFLLSDRHHSSIAHYVGSHIKWPESKIQAFADKLKRCNVASVNYRYNEKKPARKCNMSAFDKLTPSMYFDAVRCWVYHSSDNLHNLEFDVIQGFLFSLVDFEFSSETPIDLWAIG